MKRVIFDMSSVLWNCLKAGTDSENGRKVLDPVTGKAKQVNSWMYGFDNVMNSMTATLKKFDAAPRDTLMVWDGKEAKMLRRSIFSEYKAGRDHMPEEYEQFTLLREQVERQLLAVGATSVEQFRREADDVVAYLAKNFKCPVVIHSTDNDLAVLQGGNVSTYIGGELNHNKYGPFPAKYISLYKALVGDTSDNIKGAKGFGEKAFIELYVAFGEDGLDAMIDLLNTRRLHDLDADDLAAAPKLKAVLADQDGAYLGWQLAQLLPQHVNTVRAPWEVRVGMVRDYEPGFTDERLAQYAGRRLLVHAGNYQQAIREALPHLQASPWTSLDIETSAPEASDEWIEALRKNKAPEDGVGIDMFGHELTSLGLTFGNNGQVTYYLPHDHVEEPGVKNLTREQVRDFVKLACHVPLVIQNTVFELSVLHRTWGEDWKDNGWHGFLPDAHDTKLMASYVDENGPLGLKKLSKGWLDYDQVDYATVTQGRRMSQMTARETLSYGTDDTVCTAALYQWFRTVMDLEGTWETFLAVEQLPAYLTAAAFNQGQRWSLQRSLELEREDAAAREKAWATLRDYLISQGWEGTQRPVFGADITVAQIKEAHLIVTGEELKTQVRTPSKIPPLITANADLAEAARLAVEGDATMLNNLVEVHFSGEPQINFDSPAQVSRLLYETMALPIRLRNRPTPDMKKSRAALKDALDKLILEGADEEAIAKARKKLDTAVNGSARTDDLSVAFALKYDAPARPDIKPILYAYQALRTADTKAKMFYRPYRCVQHWKDGLVRPQFNQSATNTRRASCSTPNEQQMPKHEKHGVVPKIRQVVVGHHDNAVVVSLDYSGQELRLIAEYSQDENMLACYVGDNKKDMHSLTGVGILQRKEAKDLWRIARPEDSNPELSAQFSTYAHRWASMDYAQFEEARDQKGDEIMSAVLKALRALGKKTNFTTEYGAQAPKLAETLLVTEEEAQAYIDAKRAAFPRAEEWKREVVAEARSKGFVTTLMGARRHLAAALNSDDGYERSKADRQAVNFKIQSSSAEQTKLAMARCWAENLLWRFDCRFIGPVHDELVWSVHKDQAVEFIRELNHIMTRPYATMQVPVIASISLGLNWGEQIECGDEFDAGKVQEALDSLFSPAKKELATA